MSVIVRYSTGSTPNPVVAYLPSANTPDYENLPNTLVNPDLSLVSGQPQKYWKHVAGAIQLMTQGEKDAIDAAAAAAVIANAKTAAKAIQDDLTSQSRAIRAVVKETVDELNAIRQWIVAFKVQVAAATNLANLQTRVAALPDMPDRTYTQAKTAINNIVDGE